MYLKEVINGDDSAGLNDQCSNYDCFGAPSANFFGSNQSTYWLQFDIVFVSDLWHMNYGC